MKLVRNKVYNNFRNELANLFTTSGCIGGIPGHKIDNVIFLTSATNPYIIIDDVKATLTPNRNASFCTATFAVINTLKKEVKAFSGSFTVGKLSKKFSFNNIEPHGTCVEVIFEKEI